MKIFDRISKPFKKDAEPPGSTEPHTKGQTYSIGDRIANRYEIHRILGGEGKSGMGVVYVC